MTLQQLEYIVTISKYRHFGKAAEACGITQSTLSSMVQKLENELDTQIFDRNTHPISTTTLGEKLIQQAEITLYNASQVVELALSERTKETGTLNLSIIPTIAPYILPKLIKNIRHKYPKLQLSITEEHTSSIIKQLTQAKIDIALLATPLKDSNLLEIPIYYEKFVAYISPDEEIYSQKEIQANQMPSKHLWILQEGHCLRNQMLNICEKASYYSTIYEAGSIDTLIKIVDNNGGYTIIPELHLPLLNNEQLKNIRPFTNPEPNREISLVVRKDFVKEKILNILADTLRNIIPPKMIDNRLKKFAIKL